MPNPHHWWLNPLIPSHVRLAILSLEKSSFQWLCWNPWKCFFLMDTAMSQSLTVFSIQLIIATILNSISFKSSTMKLWKSNNYCNLRISAMWLMKLTRQYVDLTRTTKREPIDDHYGASTCFRSMVLLRSYTEEVSGQIPKSQLPPCVACWGMSIDSYRSRSHQENWSKCPLYI